MIAAVVAWTFQTLVTFRPDLVAWGHPGAHHPRGPGHTDRRSPRDHRAIVVAVDLDRFSH